MKNSFFRDVLTALSDLYMPRRCLVCGRHLGMRERHLCIYCAADFPLTFYWLRTRNPMADRFNEMAADGEKRYAFAAALFFYHSEAGYKYISQSLKYDYDRAAGRYFAERLGRALACSGAFRDVDAVVPVPLHWSRKWRRGYNQAAVIASVLAAALSAPMRTDIISRRRRTVSQTRLDVGEKAGNVASAFTIRKQARKKLSCACPRHILLVDDVFTTGATLNACRGALRAVLPPDIRISAATLAVVDQ